MEEEGRRKNCGLDKRIIENIQHSRGEQPKRIVFKFNSD